jgi:hypothetical protein
MQLCPTLLNEMIFMMKQSEPFGVDSQADKSLKPDETEPLQPLPQTFFVGRLKAVKLSNQKPLVLGFMFQHNILTRGVCHYPSAALVLDETKVESVLSIINDLAELAVSILIINAS